MANDGQTSRIPITTKTTISRKYQIRTDGRIFEHSQGSNSQNHEVFNRENTTRSKLPSLPSKSHISPFASGTRYIHISSYGLLMDISFS